MEMIPYPGDSLRVLLRFAQRVIYATLMFALMVMPALFLSYTGRYLEAFALSRFMLVALDYMVYALIAVDVFVFAVYVAVEVVRATRALIRKDGSPPF